MRLVTPLSTRVYTTVRHLSGTRVGIPCCIYLSGTRVGIPRYIHQGGIYTTVHPSREAYTPLYTHPGRHAGTYPHREACRYLHTQGGYTLRFTTREAIP